MKCYCKSKFDYPLFPDSICDSSGARNKFDDKSYLGALRKKLDIHSRVSRRPIGKACIPNRISAVMEDTVGLAEPEECHMFDQVEYTEGADVAKTIIEQPSIWEEGRRSLELSTGAERTEELTIEEFSARKRTTKSLIKLIKNALIKTKIQLSVDYYDVKKKNNELFSKRLEQKKAELKEDMMMSLPDEEKLQREEIVKQRTEFMKEANKELEEEVALVKKLKTDYLTQCYEYQMNWRLLDQEDFNQKSINKYSLEWRNKLNELNRRVEKSNKFQFSKETDELSLQNLVKGISKEWENAIYESQEAINEKLKEVIRDIIYNNSLIAAEDMRRRNILAAIAKSASIVESVISQFEKMVTFAFQGKPGESNFFLSVNKLKDLNKYLCYQVVKEKRKVSAEAVKILEKEEKERKGSLAGTLVREEASRDIQQFKHCMEEWKLGEFRKEVLGVKEVAEEIRCVVNNLKEHEMMEVKSISAVSRADSEKLAHRLTDAYYLAESAYLKTRRLPQIKNMEQAEEEAAAQEEELELNKRVNEIVNCLRTFPSIMRSFVSV